MSAVASVVKHVSTDAFGALGRPPKGARVDHCGLWPRSKGPWDHPPTPWEVDSCAFWISTFCSPRKGFNPSAHSFELKVRVQAFHEHIGRFAYVSRGAFIQAAINAGYEPKPDPEDDSRCTFRMNFGKWNRFAKRHGLKRLV